MPPKVKVCPNASCGSTTFETDLAAGNVICLKCFAIVESGILVSEVGFAEGSGGRMHVQGAFVSNYSTGLSGFRGSRGGQESSEQVKKQGHERIRQVAEQMGIPGNISRPAQRFFTLAVEVRFNKGRKTEYIVASCLYLQCRYAQSPKMLIDFSERLSVNVFELGATYLKLRTALHLKDPMPEVDPAIYNIRFAHRLDFGTENVTRIAADATRLVRRFRADWMTQGRRPAGVCGACMIIAARMSGFLRTPEEVAQVVKVSAYTIKRRLMEFARTQVAGKTVAEWRSLTDMELDTVNPNEEPPIVRKQRERAAAKAEKLRIQKLREEGQEDMNGSEVDPDEGGPARKKRKTEKAKGKKDKVKGRGGGEVEAGDDVDGVIKAAAEEYRDELEADQEGEEDADDNDLPEMERADFLSDLHAAGDNPEEAAKEKAKAARAFKAGIKLQNDDGDLDALAHLDGEEADPEEEQGEGLFFPGKEEDDEGEETFDAGWDKEEQEGDEDGDNGDKEEDQLEELPEDSKKAVKVDTFDQWDDQDAVLLYLGDKYFKDEKNLFKLTDSELKARVKGWITTRDPREVMQEVSAINRARRLREKQAKAKPEMDFDDLDDDELEEYYMMDESEVRLRAGLWLSVNGKWLEEDRERRTKREAHDKAHGIDPSKPKPKRKRKNAQKGPYTSTREAMTSFAEQKKFSSRINYAALAGLGMQDETNLEAFEDDEEDMGEEKEDEKYDEDEKGDDDVWDIEA